jgi:hypothetical protein
LRKSQREADAKFWPFIDQPLITETSLLFGTPAIAPS